MKTTRINYKKNHSTKVLNSLIFIGFLSVFCSNLLNAQLLYTSDFESSETIISATSYPPMYNSGNSPSIVTAIDGVIPRKGTRMMKTYLQRYKNAANDPNAADEPVYDSYTTFRTEAVVSNDQGFNAMFEQGKEYWLGVSIFIPADWSMDYRGTKNGEPVEERLAGGIILQFHDRAYKDKSWRGGLPLIISHAKEGFKISNRDSGCGNRTECLNNSAIKNKIKTFKKVAPMLKGQWNDFVMYIKWSPNSDGVLQVWVNGKEELNSKGVNYHNEHPASAYPYFKMGLYQSSYGKSDWSKEILWNTLERTLYHDELRIAGANSNYQTVFPGGTLAIDDNELLNTKITISPNPSANEITIQSSNASVKTIIIYDIQGKEVFTKQIETNEGKISMQPNLTAGIYMIKIITDKGTLSKKIIIE